MSVYAFLIFITAISGISALLFKGRFEQALPCCVCYIILVIYVSGLIGSFWPGFFVILLTLPVAGIICLIRERSMLFRDIRIYVLTPGFIFFTMTICIMLPWTLQMQINSWDEFSHWGTVIKNFWYLNDFANLDNSTTIFKGYPPGASIFAWFAQRFGRKYLECKSYLAYHVLYVSLMSPYFCLITEKREWWKAVVLGACAILLPTIGLIRVYDITYVDALLGMQAAFLIIVFCLYKDKRWQNVSIFLMTIVLCLTKASGIGLCGIILIIFIIAEMKNAHDKKLSYRKALFLPCLMGTAMLIGKYSWSVYLKISGTAEAWNTSNLTLEGIAALVTGRSPAYHYDVIRNFGSEFIHAPVINGGLFPLSCLGWSLIFILGAIFIQIHYIHKENGKSKIICTWGVLAGIPVYACSLLLLYLFTYSKGEALNCASFDRYMGTWMICCCAVLLVFLFVSTKDGAKQYGIWGAVLMILLGSNLSEYKAILTAKPLNWESYKECPMGQHYQFAKDTLDSYNRADIKVYFVEQKNTLGLEPLICMYRITPYHIQRYDPSYFEEGYSAAAWVDLLKKGNYTHIFLNQMDDAFKDNFETLFQGGRDEIKDAALYEIMPDGDTLKFIKIKEYW